MRISLVLLRIWCFPLPPEGEAPYRRTLVWGPGGHPESTKKRYENKVLKKRSQKRPLGVPGEPRGAPGSPNEAKKGARRVPKEVQKRCFYMLFCAILTSQKINILGYFNVPNRGRNREATKRGQKRSKMVAGRVRSGPGAENWSQQASKRGPKRLPK